MVYYVFVLDDNSFHTYEKGAYEDELTEIVKAMYNGHVSHIIVRRSYEREQFNFNDSVVSLLRDLSVLVPKKET